jgi:Lipopolysaccharide-assembly
MRLPRIIFILAASLLAGCANYHLGPVNGAIAGAQSVDIRPFNNQTLEPRLGDAVTQALRERLQTDGTYRLDTHGDGDVIVTGIITHYHDQGLSYLNSDASTTQNYRVNMVVHVTARERSTGKVLLEKDVTGFTLVNVGSDLASSERQAVPLLAQDLAGKISGMLTEGAW